ncbi:MAG: prephenate dehydratase [Phycisphaerales bacterium]|nr:prephenate dehydratase [Phycisphaerales bacterium]
MPDQSRYATGGTIERARLSLMAGSTPTPPDPTPDLQALRVRIDELDQTLVQLLNERASIVVDIGKAKAKDGTPIYAPDRESAVLTRIIGNNEGPLPDRTIEGIWRELMSGSFRLERPLRICYLGPPGTFSHLAALRHFGSSTELVHSRGIDSTVEEVESGRADYGLVPYENSIGGSVHESLEVLAERRCPVCAETMVAIDQALMANCSPGDIHTIASRPEALAQCRKWIGTHHPNTKIMETGSTATAVEMARDTPGIAAIGCRLAGSINGVKILFDRIQDRAENVTRFLVLGKQSPSPTGRDRTTILFETDDRPGALVDVLLAFRENGVNLTHIDKCPSRRENWTYTFFIDTEGHRDDDAMRRTIEAATPHCASIRILGSYPQAARVL